MTAFGLEIPYTYLNPEELMITIAIFISIIAILIVAVPLYFSKTKSTEVK